MQFYYFALRVPNEVIGHTLGTLFYNIRKIIETDLNDHSRVLNFFQVSLDDILNCPLEMTSIMEDKETMQRKDKGDIPQ